MTMIKLIISVHSCPINTPNSFHAIEFIKAAIAKKHTILQVFFYSQGVNNANKSIYFAEDETNFVTEWQKLQEQHNIILNCCIGSALKRGIIALNNNQKNNNLAQGFNIVGTTSWIEASNQADRMVQF